MKTNIIKIGNSQGIRIPKVVLEQAHLSGEVELEVLDEQIVIRKTSHPRESWNSKFRLMANNGDDKLVDENSLCQSSWDKEEWEW
jgi:antitoxin MazE